MAKERVCTGCEHNNNGWCKIKKTNKGLKELEFCDERRDNKIGMVQGFIKAKTYEYSVNPSEKLKGELDGLKIALSIMEG